MARIRYTKTYFQTPSRISEEVYYGLKQELERNPNFEIAQGETFSEHFNVKIIAISLIVGIIIFSIAEEGTIFFGLGMISFLIFFGSLFPLFLEGPSYATYVKKSNDYFARMKYAIINSKDYNEFIKIFY
jgi:hypothetical protein